MNRITLINTFFNELSLKTRYAMLHHPESIYNASHDIDFIVNLNFQKMKKHVKKFSLENSLLIVNQYVIDRGIYRFDLLFTDEINNCFELLELDCACISKGNDLLFLDTNFLMNETRQVRVSDTQYFNAISKENEYNYYIKKKAHKKQDVLKHLTYLKNLKSDITTKEIQEKYKLWENYYNSVTYKFYKIYTKGIVLIQRCFQKTGLCISFLGPDGSGKSTIINDLQERPLPFRRVDYFHLMPRLLSAKGNGNTVVNPHMKKPYWGVLSYLKLFHFMLEYILGWPLKVIPLKIKSSLIIFDRYYDDVLVDSRRYRYGGDIFFAKIMRFFIPKPELYFVLIANEDVIYKRKQEVEIDELRRQLKSYNRLIDGKRYIYINVNRDVKEIVKEIEKIMYNKLNERF